MLDTSNPPLGSPAPDDRILPWLKVRDIAGISRTTAWRLQNIGEFPRPVMLSPGRVGWRESDIRAWRASRVPRGQPAPAPLFDPCRPPAPRTNPRAEPSPQAPLDAPKALVRASAARRQRRPPNDQLSFDFQD